MEQIKNKNTNLHETKNNMKTSKNKKSYLMPLIERIQLDNEISLILLSGENDPGEPGDTGSLSTDYLKPNPFKTILS